MKTQKPFTPLGMFYVFILAFRYFIINLVTFFKLVKFSTTETHAITIQEEKEKLKRTLKMAVFDGMHTYFWAWGRLKHLSSHTLSRIGMKAILPIPNPKLNFKEAIEEITHCSFIPGNKITSFCDDNANSYEERVQLVKNAKKRIICCAWSFENDAIGKEFGDLLIQKVKSGVEVRIIFDIWVAHRITYGDSTYPDFLTSLIQQGIKIHILDHNYYGKRHHRKIFIVDSQIAIIGGRNVGAGYALENEKAFLDLDITFQGPAAEKAESMIYKIIGEPWIRSENSLLPHGNVDICLVDHEGNFRGEDPILEGILRMLTQAKETIDIAYAYIIPSYSIRLALIRAKGRGVRVRILTNSQYTVDFHFFANASYRSLIPLLDSEIEIYLMKVRPLHIKFCLVDSKIFSIGSHNLTPFSYFHECELNAFVYDPELGKQLKEPYDKWIDLSFQVTSEEDLKPPQGFMYHLANFLYWGWKKEEL